MQIGLRQMAGVARFGKKAEISQFQVRHDLGYLCNYGCIGLALKKGMGKHQAKEQDTCAKQGQANTRFSRGEPCPAHFFRECLFNQNFS